MARAQEMASSLSKGSLASLQCPSCTNVTRRRPGNLSPSNGAVSDKTNNNAQAVTLDSISRLLDQKLAPSSTLMTNLRESLRADIKEMLAFEVDKSVQALKNEFTVTTDHISACQSDLQASLTAKVNEFKCLENKYQSLQNDMIALQSRLKTMEHMSRNLNVEIQAVPEGRHENLLELFNTLCASLGLQIADSDVRACRRVAKINPSSPRPRNIIVTLASPRLRDTLLSAAHRFNKANSSVKLGTTHMGLQGDHSRIYVAEHLSPECKKLHAAARSFAKDRGFKYVWVRNSQVYIRKCDNSNAVHIRDEKSFNNFDSSDKQV
ncbi:uncharacterized protein LOC134666869 [Cydia fagiglandana]|uniref:uncharacterized protein LOC134666869 n=1 Tax=Cydia fagiglandana TaxID=1458189 RepID=UPI002FEE2363